MRKRLDQFGYTALITAHDFHADSSLRVLPVTSSRPLIGPAAPGSISDQPVEVQVLGANLRSGRGFDHLSTSTIVRHDPRRPDPRVRQIFMEFVAQHGIDGRTTMGSNHVT
jgi:hypothetical protein